MTPPPVYNAPEEIIIASCTQLIDTLDTSVLEK
jgi:hypothetical protein